MQRVRLIGTLAIVTACFLAAGCGGSDDSSSSSADPAEATEDTAAPAAEQDAASDGNESESSEVVNAEVPNLSEGAWEGTIHFEISGDVDVSADVPGGAFTQGDITIMTFADDTDGIETSQVAFSNDPAQESAVFVTADDVSAGGVIGKECSVSMSTN
ncbi:MAG: hypothetical protein EHM63_08625, partial [Actinobacteria bacterium]